MTSIHIIDLARNPADVRSHLSCRYGAARLHACKLACRWQLIYSSLIIGVSE